MMTAPADDYCELCELPLSTCVHGRPPAPPVEPPKKAPAPRVRQAARVPGTPAAATRKVPRRWTPSEDFRPHILTTLQDHGGRLDADDLMGELESRLADTLTPGDRERAPQGGDRWHVAVRRQRKEMIDEGLVVPAQPGVWELTAQGRRAPVS